jgi:hypothetical protein
MMCIRTDPLADPPSQPLNAPSMSSIRTDAVWFRTRKEDFVFCDFSDGSAICLKLNGRVQRRHRVVAGMSKT